MGNCGTGIGSIFGGNCSWILIILVLLFCCGGFGSGSGCGGGIFGGNNIIWILILVFFLFPGFGSGFGGVR